MFKFFVKANYILCFNFFCHSSGGVLFFSFSDEKWNEMRQGDHFALPLHIIPGYPLSPALMTCGSFLEIFAGAGERKSPIELLPRHEPGAYRPGPWGLLLANYLPLDHLLLLLSLITPDESITPAFIFVNLPGTGRNRTRNTPKPSRL